MKHKISDKYKFIVKFSFANTRTLPTIYNVETKKTFTYMTYYHDRWNNYVSFKEDGLTKMLKVTRKNNIIVPNGPIKIKSDIFHIKEGLLHREDGPAIENKNLYSRIENYFLDGQKMDNQTFWEKQKTTEHAFAIFKEAVKHQEWAASTLKKKFKIFMNGGHYADIVQSKKYTDSYSDDTLWILEDPFCLSGSKTNKMQYWEVMDGEDNYTEVEGILHRDDGPAYINTEHGTKEYYLFGERLSLEDYWQIQKDTKHGPKVFATVYGENQHGEQEEASI